MIKVPSLCAVDTIKYFYYRNAMCEEDKDLNERILNKELGNPLTTIFEFDTWEEGELIKKWREEFLPKDCASFIKFDAPGLRLGDIVRVKKSILYTDKYVAESDSGIGSFLNLRDCYISNKQGRFLLPVPFNFFYYLLTYKVVKIQDNIRLLQSATFN